MKRFKPLALILGPLLYFVIFCIGLHANYSAPRLPMSFDWEEERWLVREDRPPLRAGDQLLQIGESPVSFEVLLVDNAFLSTREQFWQWLDTKSQLYLVLQAQQVATTLERAGEEMTVQLSVRTNSWRFMQNAAIVHFPVSAIFLLVGWATYRRADGNRQASLFYLLCLSMSLVYLTNVASLLANPVLEPAVFQALNLVNVINFVMAPTLLLHFALLIPTDRAKLWVIVPLYASAFLAVVSLNIEAHGLLVPLLFLGSMAAILQGALSYRGVIERQQMKWVGVGFLLGIGPWFVLNGLPLLLTGQRLMADTIPGACLVFIPIFMAVAVQRYRLFDVSSFLESTFVYLATVAVLLVVDILILTLLGLGVAPQELHILSLALVVGLYGPVRAKLAQLVARLAHRQRVTDLEALERLNQDMGAVSFEEMTTALKMTVQSLFAPTSFEVRTTSESPVGAHLAVSGSQSVELVLAPDLALHCGSLSGGRFYTSQDLAQLDLLTVQCSLAYHSALHARQAQEEKAKSLEQKERLLGDLHDGVGASLANIRICSSEEHVVNLAGDALFELQNFLYDGPDYTMPRSDFVAELRSYGAAFFRTHPLEFDLEVKGAVEGQLPRSFGLSVFRLFRESLVNVLKHSEAQTLQTVLSFSDELVMRIADDGKGHTSSSQGRGLSGMSAKATAMGGSLQIKSGEGTTLEFRLPL